MKLFVFLVFWIGLVYSSLCVAMETNVIDIDVKVHIGSGNFEYDTIPLQDARVTRVSPTQVNIAMNTMQQWAYEVDAPTPELHNLASFNLILDAEVVDWLMSVKKDSLLVENAGFQREKIGDFLRMARSMGRGQLLQHYFPDTGLPIVFGFQYLEVALYIDEIAKGRPMEPASSILARSSRLAMSSIDARPIKTLGIHRPSRWVSIVDPEDPELREYLQIRRELSAHFNTLDARGWTNIITILSGLKNIGAVPEGELPADKVIRMSTFCRRIFNTPSP